MIAWPQGSRGLLLFGVKKGVAEFGELVDGLADVAGRDSGRRSAACRDVEIHDRGSSAADRVVGSAGAAVGTQWVGTSSGSVDVAPLRIRLPTGVGSGRCPSA